MAPGSAEILTFYVGWASTFGEPPERGVELLRKAARTGFPPAKEMLAKLGQPAQ